MAILSSEYQTKGVDSTQSAADAVESAKILCQKYKSVICVSGETDYIVSEDQIAMIHNGHKLMSMVTGMGCTATALIGAFAAVVGNNFEAAISGMALMGIAGELAYTDSKGPGSLQMHFYDKLYNLTKEEFFKTIKLKTGKYV